MCSLFHQGVLALAMVGQLVESIQVRQKYLATLSFCDN